MKKKISEWIAAYQALALIAPENNIAGYYLGKARRAIEPTFQAWQEQHDKAFKKYATKHVCKKTDEDKTMEGRMVIAGKSIDDFNAELKPLLQREEEIEIKSPVKLELIRDLKPPLTAEQFAILDGIIQE